MSSDDESGDDVATVQDQLADVPFEDIQRLRSQGHGVVKSITHKGKNSADEKAQRRANKNRPMEMSSKRPVPRLREIIQAPKEAVRDPRFESLCGDYDEARFKKAYGFIYKDALPSEAQQLKKQIKKEKHRPERRQDLKQRLSSIEAQMKEEEGRRRREEKEQQQKQHVKEQVDAGKQPYFVSKGKRRREELVEKYKELKASGKLEAFLAKRRKKNATKEHKKVPLQRRS